MHRAAPITRPMQTRPSSPIQLLSKAYFKKKAAAKTNRTTASQPSRLPIHFSMPAPSDGGSDNSSGNQDDGLGAGGLGGGSGLGDGCCSTTDSTGRTSSSTSTTGRRASCQG